jgi:metalloendopeptidase OMA1, mitochondrial
MSLGLVDWAEVCMHRRTFLCGCGAAALVAGCATAPETGRSQLILVSDAEMNRAGAQAYRQVVAQQGVERDPELQRRVQTVGRRIAAVSGAPADQNWEFAVLRDDSPNAFVLPGGKVAVHRGLFRVARNDDQLAVVLGHEVAHDRARHGAERVSQQVLQQGSLQVLGATTGSPLLMQAAATAITVGLTLPYSRAQESEADEIGLLYMARAGYDPRQAIELWRNMERAGAGGGVEFLSTHPSPGNRINRLQALMPGAMEEYRRAGRQV